MSLPQGFLEGRTALVTGASAGIGRCIARTLADAGMNVVLAARNAERLAEVEAEIIQQTGVKAISVPTDVTIPHSLQSLVDTAIVEFGSIDVLVNNAGVDAYANFHELDADDIRETIDTNITGSILLTHLVIPHMLDSGWGRVINMASTAGRYSPPHGAVYGATKAAMIAFTQSIRAEYRKRKISASAICPGFATEGGIYDRLREETGVDPPLMVGSTTAQEVARATLNAIHKDLPDIIVNSMPQRPFFALNQLFPRLAEYLFRRSSLRYFKMIGTARQAASSKPVTNHRRSDAA